MKKENPFGQTTHATLSYLKYSNMTMRINYYPMHYVDDTFHENNTIVLYENSSCISSQERSHLIREGSRANTFYTQWLFNVIY